MWMATTGTPAISTSVALTGMFESFDPLWMKVLVGAVRELELHHAVGEPERRHRRPRVVVGVRELVDGLQHVRFVVGLVVTVERLQRLQDVEHRLRERLRV
jgi:hypothetical protein